ncbi:MAG: DUF6644 family protein [Pseudomonadota bacterium]
MLNDWAIAAEASTIAALVTTHAWVPLTLKAVHMLALAVVGGAALIADLRLIGVGLVNHSVATLHRAARPWFYLGIALLLLSGIPLWMANATALNAEPLFQLKMLVLLLTVLYAITVRDAIIAGAIRVFRGPRLTVRLAGLVSLLLWLTVAALGRYQTYTLPVA